MSNNRRLSSLLYGVVVGVALTVMLLFVTADIKPYKPIFSEPQIWAHRGYSEEFLPNSIPAFNAAIELGAGGIEMDLFWDDDLNTFVVSHDKPYIKPYDQLLTLPQVLDSLSDVKINYWLDLKNLEKGNVKQVIDSLNELLDQYNCRQRVFVESEHGWLLRRIEKANIRTIYWVQFGRTWPRQMLKRTYVNLILLFSDFDGITTANFLFDETFRRHFNNYPVFVWHVEGEDAVRELLYSPGVNVILTGDNVFHLNPGNR
jgi:glycerophosphoryl diester phosphodiesterase